MSKPPVQMSNAQWFAALANDVESFPDPTDEKSRTLVAMLCSFVAGYLGFDADADPVGAARFGLAWFTQNAALFGTADMRADVMARARLLPGASRSERAREGQEKRQRREHDTFEGARRTFFAALSERGIPVVHGLHRFGHASKKWPGGVCVNDTVPGAKLAISFCDPPRTASAHQIEAERAAAVAAAGWTYLAVTPADVTSPSLFDVLLDIVVAHVKAAALPLCA